MEYQTLYEYYTALPLHYNHRHSWSLQIAKLKRTEL